MKCLITGARIVNGDGVTPPYLGDALIDGDRIVSIGEVPPSARRDPDIVVDARGKALAPGFIDMHNHGALGGTAPGEVGLPRACAMSITGGVTARICGVDGLSPAPVKTEDRFEFASALHSLDGDIGEPWSWNTLEEFYGWHQGRSATDLGMYLGHGAVRRFVMGNAARPATDDELRQMVALVKREASSALGLSTGLVYNPAVYSDARELSALMAAFVSVKPGALFPHLRSESDGIGAALVEAVSASVDAGAGYCNEHTKIAGSENYHKINQIEGVLADAAASVPTMENMYPYMAGSTMGTALFPPPIRAGTRDEFLARLRDPGARRTAFRWVSHDRTNWDNFAAFCGGLGGIQIAGVRRPEDERFLGQRLSDVAAAAGHDDPDGFGAFDAVCDFFVANDLDVAIITHYGDEPTMLRFFQRDSMAICSDGLMPGPGQKPHPRVIGTFPKALRLARVLGIPLERIIYRMTAMPAAFLRLPSPVLRVGADASLVLFDPENVAERNSYEEPLIKPVGITDVWIHGCQVLQDGHLSLPTELPGRILRSELLQ